MKFRESGMPDQEMWDQFFNSDVILDERGLRDLTGNIVDLGCGYGTFTIPAARKNKGMIYALDIEEDMITAVQQKASEAGLRNVLAIQRDFLAEGTGLPDRSCEYAMPFNILHADEPLKILSEAKRILAPSGKVAVIHWNYDSTTPRGPSMEIRPRHRQFRKWLICWEDIHNIRNEAEALTHVHNASADACACLCINDPSDGISFPTD
jgi:ubiquinone/menaquinone biosynthesis C-methylase UbiE